MKAIALLVVALALIGVSAAWDSTNYLNYQFTKVVNTQAGEHLDWFGPSHDPGVTPVKDVTSSAEFTGLGAYGTEYAKVSNAVEDIKVGKATVAGGAVDTHDILTQGGSAVVGTVAPNPENPAGLKKFGTATAYENLHLSGAYTGDIQAKFSQDAACGVDGVNIAGSILPSTFDWPSAVPLETGDRPFSAQVEAEDCIVTEVDLGQSVSAGFAQIQAPGAFAMFSGETKAWAGFSGAYNPNGGQINDLEASVANEAVWTTSATPIFKSTGF